MPATSTKRLSYHIADQFKESFSEAAPSRLYMFIGRTGPYANDSVASTPTDTVQKQDYNIYKQMLAAKKIQETDVTYALIRRNWANNNLYAEYTNTTLNSTLHNSAFYVYTSDRNVYKCIFNNKGANSTVEPTGTSTGVTSTSDGYQWKYMFTVSTADVGKFVTAEYIPVKVITADDSSGQFAVQDAAVDGAIDVIDVSAGGSGYLTNNGSFQAVTNATSMRIATTASANDSVYIGSTLYIDGGKAAGLIREITSYTGATRTVTVNTAFSTTPNTSSTYIVSPKVAISGDGTGAAAYSNVATGGSAVNYINMISTGSGYTNATVTISANTSFGSAATAVPYIGPRGGHGKNAREELGGSYVMVATEISGDEANTIPQENDIRTFGIIADPIERSTRLAANTGNFDMTTRLTLSGATGDFSADELITGGTSGATGNVVSFSNTNAANSAGSLRVINITGRFQNNETITGSVSSKTATIQPAANSDLTFYKGNVLYTENILKLTRSVDQIENFKVIFSF